MTATNIGLQSRCHLLYLTTHTRKPIKLYTLTTSLRGSITHTLSSNFEYTRYISAYLALLTMGGQN